MTKVKIMTDSTADLPEGMADQLGIAVIPLYVNMGGQSYLDGADMDPEHSPRPRRPPPATSWSPLPRRGRRGRILSLWACPPGFPGRCRLPG